MEKKSNCLLWFSRLGLMWDGYIDEDNKLYMVYYPHGGVSLLPIDDYDERYENDITIYPN